MNGRMDELIRKEKKNTRKRNSFSKNRKKGTKKKGQKCPAENSTHGHSTVN